VNCHREDEEGRTPQKWISALVDTEHRLENLRPGQQILDRPQARAELADRERLSRRLPVACRQQLEIIVGQVV
jgi:hypothetical protein